MSAESSRRGEHGVGVVAARAALVRWVREGGTEGRIFLQAFVRVDPGGTFSVRHHQDRYSPPASLRLLTDPFAAREIAQTREDGEHRPLKTAPELRRGWRFEALDERGLWTVLDYLYPACVNHWHAANEGELRVTHWSETAARQSGIYSAVRLLPEPAVRDVVRACCANEVCLRQVAWGMSPDDPAPLSAGSEGPDDASPTSPGVPCPEACSIFVSLARVVLKVEREPRRMVEGLGPMSDSEMEQIRSLVAEAASGGLEAPREGEFDLPLNRRRLRYLAMRIARHQETSPTDS